MACFECEKTHQSEFLETLSDLNQLFHIPSEQKQNEIFVIHALIKQTLHLLIEHLIPQPVIYMWGAVWLTVNVIGNEYSKYVSDFHSMKRSGVVSFSSLCRAFYVVLWYSWEDDYSLFVQIVDLSHFTTVLIRKK